MDEMDDLHAWQVALPQHDVSATLVSANESHSLTQNQFGCCNRNVLRRVE